MKYKIDMLMIMTVILIFGIVIQALRMGLVPSLQFIK